MLDLVHVENIKTKVWDVLVSIYAEENKRLILKNEYQILTFEEKKRSFESFFG